MGIKWTMKMRQTFCCAQDVGCLPLPTKSIADIIIALATT